MDKYKLEEVIMLIKKNLLTPDVLENILKSTTRRIETYDDSEAVEILNYLSNYESIPKEIKEEINKFLAQYETYNVKNVDKNKQQGKERKSKIMVLYIILIVILLLFLFIKLRG